MNTRVIREYVLHECRRSENVLSPAFFDQHLAVVASYGDRLARCLGANPEAVELAAYLHDLSAVRDVRTLPEHAALSAMQARELLAENGCAPDLVESVARCIVSHSSPLPMGAGSLEEICLSNADAIAQIVRPTYWLYFAYAVRRLDYEHGRLWLLQRIEANWKGLIEPARRLAESDYALARVVLAE